MQRQETYLKKHFKILTTQNIWTVVYTVLKYFNLNIYKQDSNYCNCLMTWSFTLRLVLLIAACLSMALNSDEEQHQKVYAEAWVYQASKIFSVIRNIYYCFDTWLGPLYSIQLCASFKSSHIAQKDILFIADIFVIFIETIEWNHCKSKL